MELKIDCEWLNKRKKRWRIVRELDHIDDKEESEIFGMLVNRVKVRKTMTILHSVNSIKEDTDRLMRHYPETSTERNRGCLPTEVNEMKEREQPQREFSTPVQNSPGVSREFRELFRELLTPGANLEVFNSNHKSPIALMSIVGNIDRNIDTGSHFIVRDNERSKESHRIKRTCDHT